MSSEVPSETVQLPEWQFVGWKGLDTSPHHGCIGMGCLEHRLAGVGVPRWTSDACLGASHLMKVCVSRLCHLWCVSQDKLGFAAVTNKPPNLSGLTPQRFILRSEKV